jgi:DNA helicase-2/ATP-dependent DNA helicase PcrA
VLNTPPRGLGDKTRAALLAVAREHEISVGEALEKAEMITTIPRRQQDALISFGKVMTRLRTAGEQLALPRLIDELVALTGYETYLKDGTEEGAERWANVQELRTLAEDYVALPQEDQLPSFLEEIALVSDVDEYKEAKPAATLITMHAVKGLEFPVVFMTGMEEGVFPHIRAIDSGKESELEEERRLCYVGITRAKDRAYLTYARRRSLFGRTNMNPPSRFLMELPSEGVELRGNIETEERDSWAELDWERDRSRYEERKQARRDAMLAGLPGSWTGRATKERTAIASETRFRAGDHVLHPSLGQGIVVSSVARDDDEEVTVAFPDKGVKKLMASFAKLALAEGPVGR